MWNELNVVALYNLSATYQDMSFDHSGATSVNTRHNAHRLVKSVKKWIFLSPRDVEIDEYR